MGLSNRLATKVRTSAKTIPVNIPQPWEEIGELAAASVIRAAACTLAQTKLTSSGFRGNDFLGINTSRSSGNSVWWIEQGDDTSWTVSLGQATVAGRAYDWQLHCSFAASAAGHTLEFTTPAVATKDGTQLNKGAYGELRSLITTGLSDPLRISGEAETEVSQQGTSLRRIDASSRRAADHPSTLQFSTVATAAELTALAGRVPFLLARRDDAVSWVWALGWSGNLASQHARLTLVEPLPLSSPVPVALELTCELALTGHVNTDVIASQRAAALGDVILTLLRQLDPQATVTQTPGGAR
jgi:hypothetical protein